MPHYYTPPLYQFERDALVRLILKRTDDGITEYAYDTADNLLTINFTDIRGDQQGLNYIYDALGHLHQINLGGRVISDFERGALHDEVLSTRTS
ncbi:hypothetical protein Q1J51_24365 [Pseudomonas paralactis]